MGKERNEIYSDKGRKKEMAICKELTGGIYIYVCMTAVKAKGVGTRMK